MKVHFPGIWRKPPMMSPGTEQSIQRIAALMPQLIKELKQHNDNTEAAQKEQRGGGGEEIGQIIKELRKFQAAQKEG